MNEDWLAKIIEAARVGEAEVAAARKKMFATIQNIPGGEEFLRRRFTELNLSPDAVQRFLSGEMSGDDALALTGKRRSHS